MLLLDPLAGWLTFASLLLLHGAVVMRWVLLPWVGLGDEERERLVRRSARIGSAAAAGLLTGLALVLVRQAIDFRDPFVPLSEDLTLLLGGTAWGDAWVTAIGLCLVSLVAMGLAARGVGAGWLAATPAAVALAFFPGFTGHAAAARSEHPMAVAMDALHVMSAGAWAGGLAVMLLLGRGDRRSGDAAGVGTLGALVPRFTPVALVAAAVLAVSGLYASWLNLPGVGALTGSGYGRLLLAKVAVVSAAMLAGAINWRRQLPLLLEAGNPGPLRRTAIVEALLFQAALVVTAILSRTSPPS